MNINILQDGYNCGETFETFIKEFYDTIEGMDYSKAEFNDYVTQVQNLITKIFNEPDYTNYNFSDCVYVLTTEVPIAAYKSKGEAYLNLFYIILETYLQMNIFNDSIKQELLGDLDILLTYENPCILGCGQINLINLY